MIILTMVEIIIKAFGFILKMILIIGLWMVVYWTCWPIYPFALSYVSAISSIVTATLGMYYPCFVDVTLWSTLGYYLNDSVRILSDAILINGVRKRGELLFLVHHIMTIVIVYDISLDDRDGADERNFWFGLIHICMNASAICLAWYRMGSSGNAYRNMYPPLSKDKLMMLFGISFIIFRVLLGIPIILITTRYYTRPITTLCLYATIGFNLYWTYELTYKFLHSKKKDC
jgi:hypothetical protein